MPFVQEKQCLIEIKSILNVLKIEKLRKWTAKLKATSFDIKMTTPSKKTTGNQAVIYLVNIRGNALICHNNAIHFFGIALKQR